MTWNFTWSLRRKTESLMWRSCASVLLLPSKGKAVPLHAWTGPEGSRRFRLHRFQDSRHMKLVRLSATRLIFSSFLSSCSFHTHFLIVLTHASVLWLYAFTTVTGPSVVGRNSSVSIATRYGLGWSGDRIPVGTRFSATVQTHPASSTLVTESFPGVKRPGRGVDHPI